MDKNPKKIGRYEIIEVLGKGGMGIVYKAKDPNINRIVALKVIRPSAAVDDKTTEMLVERFRREANAAGVLQHPDIVSVFDADEFEGSPYIAMEYVEGRPLDEILDEEPLAMVEKAARIVAQVANALAYAHANGIIHRDIKPANVIITEDGGAKIMDFGIAKIEDSELTKTGAVLGSPNFMSPEQITGQKIDSRSDIFSLGVMLYLMITGEKPFLGENQTSISYKIVRTDPVKPSKINPVLNPSYDIVIKKSLAKRAEERYDSATDMADDLKKILEGKEVQDLEENRTRIVEKDENQTVIVNADIDSKEDQAETSIISNVEEKSSAKSNIVNTDLSAPFKNFTITSKLKKVGGVIIAVSVIIFLFFIFRGEDEPYLDIEKYIEDKNYSKVIKYSEELTEENPSDSLAFFYLGIGQAGEGDFMSALTSFTRTLSLKPEYKNDPRMIQALLTAPRGPDAFTAVDFIVTKKGDSTIATLELALKNKDYNIHWNAADALKTMRRRVDKLPLYLMDLTSKDCDEKKQALQGIVELKDKDAVPALEEAKQKKANQRCFETEIDEAIEEISNSKSGKTGKKNPFKNLKKIFK
jgi:serine/threonine protein kinase